MNWPTFDPGEAINQAISAAATLCGVFVGGYVAFWVGVRQLRRERAIDRRLEWHEKLIAALAEYRLSLTSLVNQIQDATERPDSERASDALTESLNRSMDRGAEVRRLAWGADLYGNSAHRAAGLALYNTSINVFLATTKLWYEKPDAQTVTEIRALIQSLRENERVIVGSLRSELDIPQS